MPTSNRFGDFVVDVFKKLIVTIVATPIIALATFVYSSTILAAVSSFGTDWYAEYWYLVVMCSLVAVLEGYALYRYRSLFPWFLIVTIALVVLFSLYRLNMLPESWSLKLFFCMYLVALFNLVVIVSFAAWRAIANML